MANSMFRFLAPAGAAGVLFALAATNPPETAHVRAVVDHARGNCGDSRVIKGLCGGLASLAADMSLRYEDHLLYSTAQVGDIQTVGIFGRVVVLSE